MEQENCPIDSDDKNKIETEKLFTLLTPNEIGELIQAFGTVINFRNGYGTVVIEIRKRRIEQVVITSTIKPSLQIKDPN